MLREEVERRGGSFSVLVKLVVVGARCNPAAVLVEEFDDVRRAGGAYPDECWLTAYAEEPLGAIP